MSSKLVVRWVSLEQARRYIAQNQMRPSWKHFIPATGKACNGVCFDLMTTSSWRGDRKLAFVIDADDLPSSIKTHEIDGHKVYCLTERLRWVFNPDELKKEISEAKKDAPSYEEFPSELFVRGTIDSLGDRVKAIIEIDCGLEKAPKCFRDVEDFRLENDIPFFRMTTDEFGYARLNLSENLGLSKKEVLLESE